jgi:hypothetical protein
MSYQPSIQRLIAIPVILLALLGSGLALRALTQHTSAGSGRIPVDVASTHGTYELPPSQPHEFTLTSDGQ